MPTTTRMAIVTPASTAAPNVPSDTAAMATRIDTIATVFQQGTNSARLAAAHVAGTLWYETDTLHVYYDTGSAWVKVDPQPLLVGTSFPSSPVTGLRVTSQLALGLTGRTNWEFVYDAAITDSYKWAFSGGQALAVEDRNARTFNTNGALQFPTGTPSVTLPWAGWYEIEVEASLIPGTAPAGTAVWCATYINSASRDISENRLVSSTAIAYQTRAKTFYLATTAGQVATMGIAGDQGGVGTAQRRWMTIKPLRVSP